MDDEDFRGIARDFADALSAKLTEFVSTLEDQDFATLARHAHWLKGSGGTAGFEVFTDVGRELEVAAKEQKEDTCRAYVAEIISMLKRVQIPESV